MAILVYSALFYLLIPFICLRLLWRGRKIPGYRRRWRERFGFIAPEITGREVIWVHAVSVGETIAAVPLIRRLKTLYPEALIAVTTTTPTGSDRVLAMLGDSVWHSYAPYDLPDANSRFLNRLRPRLAIIMETELWPNLVAQCHRRGIPVVLANARLSARSAAGYRRFAVLATPMLRQLAMVAVQAREDGDRFLALGLPPERLEVTGNIKFDMETTDAQRTQAEVLRRQWRGDSERHAFLAASTHKGEDEMVLDAFKQVLARFPETLLVLVPRHPDRFDSVAELCRSRDFKPARRSEGGAPDAGTQVLLGDTMGELPVFYGACDVAFVGGSLVPVGGHNLLEPAVWRRPVIAGSHLFNFAEVSALLAANDALVICNSPGELAEAVCRLLADPQGRAALGDAAHRVVDANRGAMERLLGIIVTLY